MSHDPEKTPCPDDETVPDDPPPPKAEKKIDGMSDAEIQRAQEMLEKVFPSNKSAS